MPQHITPICRDLIVKLLSRNPYTRLGAIGADEIKKHPFFAGIDWREVAQKKIYVDKLPVKNLNG